VNGLPFSGINNITAGTANDVVNLAAKGSLSGLLNPGAGDNTLSYSAWTSDVNINAPANAATALGSVTGAYLTTLIGGAGNDTIVSSASKASVLVGNAGNDSLTGNGQRDILLGGIGSDSLTGAAADDLLFGGTTGYENNATALLSLLAEWKGPSTYASRIDHLRGSVAGGLNGTTVFANNPVDTLFDDGEMDTFTGGLGRDWFIAALNDLVIDRIISGSLVETQETP
jgi:Ca2+-binding RTX toxin-like protein